jgi:hypothetical protein
MEYVYAHIVQVLSRVRGFVTNNSGLDDLIDWHFFIITINYNRSQSMTV